LGGETFWREIEEFARGRGGSLLPIGRNRKKEGLLPPLEKKQLGGGFYRREKKDDLPSIGFIDEGFITSGKLRRNANREKKVSGKSKRCSLSRTRDRGGGKSRKDSVS